VSVATATAVNTRVSNGCFIMPEDDWVDYADYSAGEDSSDDDTTLIYDDGEDE